MPDLEACLHRQEEMIVRQQPCVSLVLTTELKMWETAVLRRQADWIKAHHDDLRKLSLGVALVIASPVVRGMLKAVLWLQPIPQPHVVVPSIAQALPWLRTRLAERKLRTSLPEPEDF